VISTESRPRLAAKARLRFDRNAQQYLLLYPERGLALNPTAAAVLELCTGEHTVEAIIERLVETYRTEPRGVLEREVLAFLRTMADRGLVKDGP
jgi:coenzyme PQQ biosynthesis protein PqqD